MSISNELQRNIAASTAGIVAGSNAKPQANGGGAHLGRLSYQQATKGGLIYDGNRTRRVIQPGVRDKIQSALHSGNVPLLQDLMIEGYGHELMGRTSFVEEARRFLKTIPQSMEAIRQLQESMVNGDQETVERILSEQPLYARARDSNSFTLMHLAVVGGHFNLLNYFAENFSQMINLKDNVSDLSVCLELSVVRLMFVH